MNRQQRVYIYKHNNRAGFVLSMSSYPIEEYRPENNGDPFGSFFGLANRLMGEMLSGGLSSDSNNPNVKVFGISSMNVTQISRGPDGRPRVVQAHDERRMGPGGVWQTKKALRDPDRGIDRMQVGYFVGNQGEIIERELDPATGQYRQQVQHRGLPANQWRTTARQVMQRPPQQQQALPYYESATPYEPYPQQQYY